PLPQTGGQGDRGQGGHVASCPIRWVGMPARVHTYVEDAGAVVNTGGEEAGAVSGVAHVPAARPSILPSRATARILPQTPPPLPTEANPAFPMHGLQSG